MKMSDRILLGMGVLWMIVIILAAYASLSHDQKCHDAGGIPVKGACINPAAIIEVD